MVCEDYLINNSSNIADVTMCGVDSIIGGDPLLFALGAIAFIGVLMLWFKVPMILSLLIILVTTYMFDLFFGGVPMLQSGMVVMFIAVAYMVFNDFILSFFRSSQ